MTNATGRNDEGMKQRRNYRVSEKGEIKNITKKYIIGGRQNEKKKKTFISWQARDIACLSGWIACQARYTACRASCIACQAMQLAWPAMQQAIQLAKQTKLARQAVQPRQAVYPAQQAGWTAWQATQLAWQAIRLAWKTGSELVTSAQIDTNSSQPADT